MASETSFISAVRNALGEVNQISKFVDKDKNCVNETDEAGDTALHLAAQEGHINLTRFLLQHGANVNQQNKVGSTPLHKAAAKGNSTVAKQLLEAHADANIKNANGLLPEDLVGDKHKLRVLLQGKDAVKVEFQVPKDRHGLIIGKAGKTLEQIRANTHTNISVPKAEDPSHNITIEGRKEGVEKAKQEIAEVLKEAEAKDAKKLEEKKKREELKKAQEEERKKKEEHYITGKLAVPKDRHGVIIGKGGAMIKELQASGVTITIPKLDSPDTDIVIYGDVEAVESTIKRIVEITARRPNNNNSKRPTTNGDQSPLISEDRRNSRRNHNGSDAATTTTSTDQSEESAPEKPRQRAPKKNNTADNTAAKDSASEQPKPTTNNAEKPKQAPKKKPNKD